MRLRELVPHLYRVPLAQPVVTSFGTMRARWALWVQLRDDAGAEGWGEVWCNFPDSGALHRCRLLQGVYAPLLTGLQGDDAAAISARVQAGVRILRLQSAEHGPLDQCSAGIDTALWDLQARREGVPLHALLRRALGDPPRPGEARVPAYASGINPQGVGATVDRARAEGHAAFKVKVGFGRDGDLRALTEARAAAGSAPLAADANQGWTMDEAVAMLPALQPFELAWLEEPIAADEPVSHWLDLHRQAAMPLALGENVNSLPAFEALLASGAVGVMQPDLAKWGGFTGCLEVVRRCRAHRVRYCPHYLGGGIGLLASAHLLAAAGGDGWLEMDVNPNPLRTDVLGGLLQPVGGRVSLPSGSGLGLTPDLGALRAWAQSLPA
ncbi:MAG: mandelate racemase/muconate lactonizing enzyme family protein [Rubrivivax sp.]|nr:mandelate racemase/muconate lactonizing enzyme family protein [Rubrivivax sp.]